MLFILFPMSVLSYFHKTCNQNQWFLDNFDIRDEKKSTIFLVQLRLQQYDIDTTANSKKINQYAKHVFCFQV